MLYYQQFLKTTNALGHNLEQLILNPLKQLDIHHYHKKKVGKICTFSHSTDKLFFLNLQKKKRSKPTPISLAASVCRNLLSIARTELRYGSPFRRVPCKTPIFKKYSIISTSFLTAALHFIANY